MPTVVACPRHPETETALRCSRCEQPICPACLIQSPVGARCPDCAKVVKNPIYTLNSKQMVRAAAAAIIGGLVLGIVWGVIVFQFRFGLGLFSVIILGVALGFAFTRIMEFATGSKRGPAVVAFAVAGMLIASSVLIFLAGFAFAVPALIAVGAGWYFAYQNLK
jgi:predicted lipid-binding transport protein (Tim44 family)